jgi:hypothetical protein
MVILEAQKRRSRRFFDKFGSETAALTGSPRNARIESRGRADRSKAALRKPARAFLCDCKGGAAADPTPSGITEAEGCPTLTSAIQPKRKRSES